MKIAKQRWFIELLWVVAVLGIVTGMLTWATRVHAQISVPELSPLYTLIEVSAVPPSVSADCKVYYEWEFDYGTDIYRKGGGQNLILTATPGTHQISLRVVCIDWTTKKYDPTDYVATFSVGNAPPIPVPDPNITPTPDNPLCDMVSVEEATRLAELYRSQAVIIAEGDGSTTAKFRSASNALLRKHGLDKTGASVQIETRIDAAIGTEDVELTDSVRAMLVECLRGIAMDLDCGLPEQGARLVVIVRETEDATVERGMLYTNLRDGTASQYISNNNHKLLLLDDDSLDETGATAAVVKNLEQTFKETGLPALIILDANTRNLLFAARLKEESTADNVIEILRQNGG